MSSLKLSIIFNLRSGAYGGGNQFLKALKGALLRLDSYSEYPADADVVLFNSHHSLKEVARLKKSHPDKVMVQRVDGPIRLYASMSDKRDAIVMKANRLFADGTVFQSKWSMERSLELGWPSSGHRTVIMNSPDPSIFNREGRWPPLSGEKVRLIATSWSDNPNKGFDVYEFLDCHLDFDRYEMTLIGNSPISFKNIRHLPPRESAELAERLKRGDIFITASRADPCSNSLIEARHCGLPALAYRDGGHPEILADGGGELFDRPDDIPQLIERLVRNYETYTGRIKAPSIDRAAGQYQDFANSLRELAGAGKLKPKKPGLLQSLLLAFPSRDY